MRNSDQHKSCSGLSMCSLPHAPASFRDVLEAVAQGHTLHLVCLRGEPTAGFLAIWKGLKPCENQKQG